MWDKEIVMDVDSRSKGRDRVCKYHIPAPALAAEPLLASGRSGTPRTQGEAVSSTTSSVTEMQLPPLLNG